MLTVISGPKIKFNSLKWAQYWLWKYFLYFWLESNYVFISYQKLPLVFSLKNTPYFNFLTKDGRATTIYNFLLLRPCTLFALKTSKNRFGFFIRLVSSIWIWCRQYYLRRPLRIYCVCLRKFMLNHNGALDPQNELQGDRKIIANVEKRYKQKFHFNLPQLFWLSFTYF